MNYDLYMRVDTIEGGFISEWLIANIIISYISFGNNDVSSIRVLLLIFFIYWL